MYMRGVSKGNGYGKKVFDKYDRPGQSVYILQTERASSRGVPGRASPAELASPEFHPTPLQRRLRKLQDFVTGLMQRKRPLRIEELRQLVEDGNSRMPVE